MNSHKKIDYRPKSAICLAKIITTTADFGKEADTKNKVSNLKGMSRK